MRLSPVPPRHRRPNLKRVTWSDTEQKMVLDLVSEANALLNIFDQVTLLLGPDIKLNPVPKLDESPMPPFQMQAKLKNSCDMLEEQINNLQPIQLLKLDSFNEELSKYSYDESDC